MWSHYIWSLTLITLAQSNPRKIKEEGGCVVREEDTETWEKYERCIVGTDVYNRHYKKWPNFVRIKDSEAALNCCLKAKAAEAAKKTTTKKGTTATETPCTTFPTTTTTEDPMVDFRRRSKEKCREYSRWPHHRSDEKIQGLCGIFDPTKILDRSVSSLEFPHMAFLGYGNMTHIKYQHSASLISDKYLLTTAHSLKGTFGPLVAKLGNGNADYEKIVKIAETIPHPEYSPPIKYNDIALLRLEKPINFNDFIRPACLHTENITDNEKMFVESYFKKGAEQIFKKTSPIFNTSQCSEVYKRTFTLQEGLDDKTMICAGVNSTNRDLCHADFGGILQIIKKKPNCMYGIIGIASFGTPCGLFPDVHTRVSAYIPWIESIVWADVE